MLYVAGSIPNQLSQDLTNISISTQTLEETRAEMPYYSLEMAQISDLTENQSLRGVDEDEVDKRYTDTYDDDEEYNDDDNSTLLGFSILVYFCVLFVYMACMVCGSRLKFYANVCERRMNGLNSPLDGFPMQNQRFSGLLNQGMPPSNNYQGMPPSNNYQGVLPSAPIEGIPIQPIVRYYSPASGSYNNN